MEIGTVRLVDIEREMQDAYLDYAMSVIVSRALPDVRDGLKPVHRRILYAMHDMGLQAQVVHRQAVMYAGKIAEIGEVKTMYKNSLHPYTKLLIKSLPTLQSRHDFQGIPGLPPSLFNPPKGCAFSNRCPYVMENCREVMPKLVEVQPNHLVACHLHSEVIR